MRAKEGDGRNVRRPARAWIRNLKESGMELAKLTQAKLKMIEEEATMNAKEAAQGEYLVCLFLLLTDDERYGPLKAQLDTNFLMEKQ